MSTKRRPQQENRWRQNFKNSFKPSSVLGRVSSPKFKTDRDKNCNNLFEDANTLSKSSELEDSDNFSDFEDDSLKVHRVRKDTNRSPTLKKKKNSPEVRDSHVSAKTKHRKDPLPMKFRAFPQSFWQQPNKTPSVSPGTVYCVPSPLSKDEDSPENRETLEGVQQRRRQEIVSKPNIDLLFSLFRNVEEEQRRALGQRNVPLIRRGRPKKSKTESKVIRDDDPYLTSSAAESFLPLLPLRTNIESLQYKIAKDEQILAMVSIDGSSSAMLTSVNSSNQNYSQILSELVVQL